MDWAIISNTLTRLETLDPDEVAAELERLGSEDSALREQVEGFRATGKVARSFMQTSIPDADAETANSMMPGDRIGIWKVEALLGTGGMGEVYEATRDDGLFEQRVALKLARDANKALSERFEGERDRLAQLEHPNIARIVDGGTTESGAPYMTMEFVDGEPVDAYVKSARLDRNARLRLIVRLCEALSHAHGRLVLHRDIKHDNVLINADGDLRLIDFGVASLLDDPDAQQGRGPLTIAYAAPEQLLGNPVSAATDIFAVGMLMHLLETESLPARQSDGGVGINAARIGDADLAAILSKATASDPAERYGSVDAMGDDLEKWLGGFPVTARPVSSVQKFRKLIARNKAASAMSAAAATAVVAGVAGVSVFAVRADEARAEAEEQLEWAEFSVEETNLTNARNVAQSGLFRSFVIEEAGVDEAQLRTFLVESAERARESYDANPESSSAVMMAVGQYLSSRGDYPNARDVTAHIIEHEATPDITRQGAKLGQARNLSQLGQTDEALRLQSEVIEWMQSKPFLRKTEGYAGIATSYALLTGREEDLREATRANLFQATKPDNDASARSYHYSNLYNLAADLGEYDEAIEYARLSVENMKGAENLNYATVNTRYFKLVDGLLMMKRDVEQARQNMPAEEDVMDPDKGQLRHRGMYHEYLAMFARAEGDYAAAFASAEKAIDLAKNDFPPESSFRLGLSGLAVETASMAGDLEGAERYLADAMVPVDGTDGKPHARGYIAQAYFLNAQGKRDEAVAVYNSLDHAEIADSYRLSYKRELLREALGLDEET